MGNLVGTVNDKAPTLPPGSMFALVTMVDGSQTMQRVDHVPSASRGKTVIGVDFGRGTISSPVSHVGLYRVPNTLAERVLPLATYRYQTPLVVDTSGSFSFQWNLSLS